MQISSSSYEPLGKHEYRESLETLRAKVDDAERKGEAFVLYYRSGGEKDSRPAPFLSNELAEIIRTRFMRLVAASANDRAPEFHMVLTTQWSPGASFEPPAYC